METLANGLGHFSEVRYTIVGQGYMGRRERLGLVQPPDVKFVDRKHPGSLSLGNRVRHFNLRGKKKKLKREEIPSRCRASRRRGPHRLEHSEEESGPLV